MAIGESMDLRIKMMDAWDSARFATRPISVESLQNGSCWARFRSTVIGYKQKSLVLKGPDDWRTKLSFLGPNLSKKVHKMSIKHCASYSYCTW